MELDATWERCRDDLRPDGALRDIYVQSASLIDWDRFLSSLGSWASSVTYSLDGIPSKLPTLAAEIFQAREKYSVNLKFVVGRITICCHFFSEDELEFDIQPDDVATAADFDELGGFMRRLGKLLEKPVILTPDSLPSSPIVEYSPTKDRLLWHVGAN